MTMTPRRRRTVRVSSTPLVRAAVSLLVLLVSLCVLLQGPVGVDAAAKKSGRSQDRSIQIINESGVKVSLYWINPNTKEESLMSNPHIMPGADFPLNSYVGHKFVAREEPPTNSETCKNEDQVCRHLFFEVTPNDDQRFSINKNFQADFFDSHVKARQEATELIGSCQARAKAKLAQATSDNDQMVALLAMDELVQCVEQGVSGALERVNEEIAFQATVRRGIAASLENYTCIDDTLDSTPDVYQDRWISQKDGIRRTVHVKHDRPASRIHVIENFIDRQECDSMEEAAKKSLHRATVADGKGGSRLSEARKAMQAGIKVPWSEEEKGHPIARLSRRVYDYTNHVLDLGIEEHGQEDLMSIQYFGRGVDEKEPDRYMPHCDGDCTGLPHKFGQRMATMVMYCDVADKGGHTNFRNAGVHVKPSFGDAIFFSYIDPETKVMDTGFTEHSGCPVYHGEKKIVTQWVRYGVDHENTWDSFNTLGVKYSEIREMERAESAAAQEAEEVAAAADGAGEEGREMVEESEVDIGDGEDDEDNDADLDTDFEDDADDDDLDTDGDWEPNDDDDETIGSDGDETEFQEENPQDESNTEATE